MMKLNDFKLNLLNYRLLTILGILPFRFNSNSSILELEAGTAKRWLNAFWIVTSAAHIFGIGARCVHVLLKSSPADIHVPEHYMPGAIFFTVGLTCIFSGHLLLTRRRPEIEAIVFRDIIHSSIVRGSGKKSTRTSLSEQFIRIMPLHIQSCVIAPLILYLVDPNFPGLLYPSARTVFGENKLTYFLSMALDTIFFTTCLNYAYNYYFLILSFINLFHGQVDEALQEGVGQGTDWNPVSIRKMMRKFQLQVQLFNHGFAYTIFATKLMSLFNAIVGGFMAIRFFHSNFPLAFAFFILAVEAVLLYVIVYDKAFDLPERMKALGRLISRNVERQATMSKSSEHRVLVNSFNLKAIQVGGFHTFERESTPNFVDHIATQMLNLLVSFNCSKLVGALGYIVTTNALNVDPENNQPSIQGTWSPGIELWTPPEDIKEQLFKDNRWYVSGYDYDKRPVIIWELGTSKVRKYGDESEATRTFFRKFTEWKWYKISHTKSPFEDAEDGIFLLIDFAGYPMSELGTYEAVKLHLHGARIIERVESMFAKVAIINADFAAQLWINLMKPVGGRWLGKAEVFGPDAGKWRPYLTQLIPVDQLPPFYGGSSGSAYKPIEVYG